MRYLVGFMCAIVLLSGCSLRARNPSKVVKPVMPGAATPSSRSVSTPRRVAQGFSTALIQNRDREAEGYLSQLLRGKSEITPLLLLIGTQGRPTSYTIGKLAAFPEGAQVLVTYAIKGQGVPDRLFMQKAGAGWQIAAIARVHR